LHCFVPSSGRRAKRQVKIERRRLFVIKWSFLSFFAPANRGRSLKPR